MRSGYEKKRLTFDEKTVDTESPSGLEGDRHYELAKEMAAAGMEVVVFLSAFDHQTETCICEKVDDPKSTKKGVSYVMASDNAGLSWQWDCPHFKYDKLLSAYAKIREDFL